MQCFARTNLLPVAPPRLQICVAVDEDSLPSRPSAQQRFVAALQVGELCGHILAAFVWLVAWGLLFCLENINLCMLPTHASKLTCEHYHCHPCKQASLHAAAEAGLEVGGNEHRWEAPGTAESRAADVIYDPATRMFWRNVRTRVSGREAVAKHGDNSGNSVGLWHMRCTSGTERV